MTGAGVLRLGAAERAVSYSLNGNPATLRRGPKGLRGAIEADPETAAEAFRVVDGYLVLADGAEYRVKILAHTEGSGTAYFELWRSGSGGL